MKKPTWDNPNKMHIETGHKTFDKQTNIIGHGNIVANTMLGLYVRSERDLTPFKPKYGNIEGAVLKALKSEWARGKTPILYCIFHYTEKKPINKVIHGYIITDSETHKEIYRYISKSSDTKIINTCKEYLCN